MAFGAGGISNGLIINDNHDNGNTGTVDIYDGASVGSITNQDGGYYHIVNFLGDGSINDDIDSIAKVTGGAAGKTLTFSAITADLQDLQFSGAGYINLEDTTLQGSINLNGGSLGLILTLDESTVSGSIGAGQKVNQVTVKGTSQVDGNIKANSIRFNSAFDIFYLGDGVQIDSDIVTNVEGGTLIFDGDATVNGEVGEEGTALGEIKGGVDNSTVTFNGSVDAKYFSLRGNGTMSFTDEVEVENLNTNAGSVNGNIVFYDDATITENNSKSLASLEMHGNDKTVTFEGDTLKVVDLVVGSQTDFKITDNVTVNSGGSGSLTQNGSLTLGENSLDISDLSGGVSVENDATINFTITDFTGEGTGGKLVLGNDIVITGDNSITLVPTLSGVEANDGDTYTLSTNEGISGGTIVVSDSGDVKWDVSTVDGIVLTAIIRNLLAAGVDVRFTNATENAPTDIQNKLKAGSVTDSERKVAGAQLAPEANNSSVEQTMAVVDQIGALVDARTSAVRSGIATGDALENVGLWGQFFGFAGTQDKRNGVDGYDAKAHGFAIGADNEFGKGLVLGLALSYGRSDITGNGDTKYNGTDINSYGINLYGTKDMGSYNLDASLGYAYHDYDGNRVVNSAGIFQNLSGSYSGNQYSVGLGVNKAYKVGSNIVTPWGSVDYSYLNQGSYKETGGTAALKVDTRNTDSFKTGLGVKLNSSFNTSKGKLTPELKLGWYHEFGDNQTDVTASYATGGAAFKTEGVTLPRDSAVIGLGVDLVNSSNWTLSANYDAELKENYDSHTGRLQLRYDF